MGEDDALCVDCCRLVDCRGDCVFGAEGSVLIFIYYFYIFYLKMDRIDVSRVMGVVVKG